MSDTHTPADDSASDNAQSSRPPSRKLRTLGAGVTPEQYAEMQALAAVEDRTLSYLGGLAISEFLARRQPRARI